MYNINQAAQQYINEKIKITETLFKQLKITYNERDSLSEIKVNSKNQIEFITENATTVQQIKEILNKTQFPISTFIDAMFNMKVSLEAEMDEKIKTSRQAFISNIKERAFILSIIGEVSENIVKNNILLCEILSLRGIIKKTTNFKRTNNKIKKEILYEITKKKTQQLKISKSEPKYIWDMNFSICSSIDTFSRILRNNKFNPHCNMKNKMIPRELIEKYSRSKISLIDEHQLKKINTNINTNVNTSIQLNNTLYAIKHNTEINNQPYLDWRLRIYSEGMLNITFNKYTRSLMENTNSKTYVKNENSEKVYNKNFEKEIESIKGYFKTIKNKDLLLYVYNLLLEYGKVYKNVIINKQTSHVDPEKLVKISLDKIMNNEEDLQNVEHSENILLQRISIKVKECLDESVKEIKSNIYIYRDAIGSGIQNMSQILESNDELNEKLNLKDDRYIYDSYTHFIQKFIKTLDEHDDRKLKYFVRKNLKLTMMTILYGAGKKKTLKYFLEKINKDLNKEELENISNMHNNFFNWFKEERIFKISQKEFIENYHLNNENYSYTTEDHLLVDNRYFLKREEDKRIKIKIKRERCGNPETTGISEQIFKESLKILLNQLEEKRKIIKKLEINNINLEEDIKKIKELIDKHKVGQKTDMNFFIKIIDFIKKFISKEDKDIMNTIKNNELVIKYRTKQFIKNKNKKFIIDTNKTKLALMANIMHAQDAYVIRVMLKEMIKKSNNNTFAIHDCIIIPFENLNDYIKKINEIFKTNKNLKYIWF